MTQRELMAEIDAVYDEVQALRLLLTIALWCLRHNPAALEPGGNMRTVLEDEVREWAGEGG